MLRHVPKEEAIGVMVKEIQKIRSNSSMIQECMQTVEDRETTLQLLKDAVTEFEERNSD